jgi:hypothetical protein
MKSRSIYNGIIAGMLMMLFFVPTAAFAIQALPLSNPTSASVTTSTATLGGTLSSGGGTITAEGITWGLTPNMTKTPHANVVTSSATSTGAFTVPVTGLPAGTPIYFNAYATNSTGASGYSTDGTFTTQGAVTAPTVTTPTSTSVTTSTATLGGNITSNGGGTITAEGITWGTSANPQGNAVVSSSTSTGVFTVPVTSLPAGTLIYFDAYATNSAGTTYSSDGTFTTQTPVTAPTVTTPTSASVTTSTATLGGNITSNGGGAITAEGITWGTSANPRGNVTVGSGTSTGAFTVPVTGLPAGTLIYFDAYATNSAGTTYSSDGTFLTQSTVTVPTIVQSAKYQPSSAGTSVTFTLGTGPVAGDVLVAFTAYSQYSATRIISAPDGTWTQIDNQTNSNDSLATWWHLVSIGDGTTYAFPITGSTEWQSGVIYEISGANSSAPINQHAISISASASSVTTPSVTPSILKTLPLTGVDTDSGSSAGLTLSSISSGWTSDQSAIPGYHATFGAHENALTADTTTPISNTFNFSAASSASVQSTILIAPRISSPTVTTPTSASVTTSTATLGGNITSNGGGTITAEGITWGTSANPQGNITASSATSTGVFTVPVTSLPAGTLIYFDAYATNSAGTTYSSDGTFTTTSGGSGAGGGYSYYIPITVTSTTSIASGTQSNFPMLVSSTLSQWIYPGHHIQNLVTAPNGGQEPADLIFSTSTTCANPLNFETESYSPSTGALVDWVNVPTMQAGQVIYACYGNSAAAGDQSHPSSTWNSNYQAVWHMTQNPAGSAPQILDSTANGNNGTTQGSMPSGQSVPLAFANGLQFNNGSQFVSFATTTIATNTFSAIVEPYQVTSGWHCILCSVNSITGIYQNAGTIVATQGSNPGGGSLTADVPVWAVITNTYSYPVIANVYVNGLFVASGTAYGYYGGYVNQIGSDGDGQYLNGIIGEARITNNIETPSWILTEYNNQSSPSTFYTIGSESGGAVTAPTVTTPTLISITTSTATLGGNITSNGGGTITAEGITWGISANPRGNAVVSSSTSTGVFTVPVTGLPSGTQIYFDAYATNSAGTTYSSDGTFTTAAIIYGIFSASTTHWAWNDEIGWIDFSPEIAVTVNVSSAQLTGYASSSVGSISLDCGTAPNGSGGTQNICGTSNYKVSNNGSGNLSGWAWNDEIGWISFYWGNASANPVAQTTALCQSYSSYCGVYIDGAGVFHGWAWNDTVGWISFNCANTSCPLSNFDVVTTWTWTSQGETGTLDSQTFDTGVTSGAQLNSITWKGNVPSGTSVGFQIAVSNSASGPWNFIGPDGTSATTYTNISGSPISLGNYSSLDGRYFRYRVILTTNTGQTATPQVTSVIVNWSP